MAERYSSIRLYCHGLDYFPVIGCSGCCLNWVIVNWVVMFLLKYEQKSPAGGAGGILMMGIKGQTLPRHLWCGSSDDTCFEEGGG